MNCAEEVSISCIIKVIEIEITEDYNKKCTESDAFIWSKDLQRNIDRLRGMINR